MDPSAPNQNQSVTPPQFPQPSPVGQTPYQPAGGGSGKKIALIIGGIIGVLFLLFIAMIALTTYNGIQQRAKANAVVIKFYSYALEKDSTKLATLYDDKDAKDFVEQAAAKVEKGCSVKDGSFKELTTKPQTTAEIKGTCPTGTKDWTFGLTYNEKKKDWVLTKLVFGSASAPTAQPTVPPASGSLACITQADASFFPNSAALPDVYTYFYDDNFFFTADSTTYQYPDQTKTRLTLFADFYKKHASKAFTYHLEGAVNEGAQSAAGKQLAQQRAELIKSELVSLGVPADRIVIDAPKSIANQYIAEASRNVTISVKPDKNCGGSSTSSGR